MGFLDKLFGRKPERSGETLLQVGLIFICNMVPNNEEVLRRAVTELVAKNPGQLVRKPEVTVAPKANTNTITLTVRVRNQDEAFAFKQTGEIILRRYGLQS